MCILTSQEDTDDFGKPIRGEGEPDSCPKCKSDNYEVEDMEMMNASYDWHCNRCNAKWRVFYEPTNWESKYD